MTVTQVFAQICLWITHFLTRIYSLITSILKWNKIKVKEITKEYILGKEISFEWNERPADFEMRMVWYAKIAYLIKTDSHLDRIEFNLGDTNIKKKILKDARRIK